MLVAVLAAMSSELRPFVRAAGLQRTGEHYGGQLGGHEIVATTMGVGMTRAAKSTEEVLGSRAIDRLVVIGIAGGIDTTLPIGHVVTPEVIVDGETGVEYRPSGWAPVEPQGRLVTYNEFQTELEAMTQLQRDGFTVVDMETAAVAAVCERSGCVYSVFRAISDNATDGSVDAAIAGLLQPDGTTDRRAALRYVLRQPWRIPHLARLGRDSQRASRAAAAAAIRALQESAEPA
ncbi:MAG TPA: hypothetical protein VGJ86_17855 [Acidimicrobiales bacterium]|jgi:nucleoside phosphorylase